MSKEYVWTGIKEAQIGLPGDGVVGASLTTFNEVKVSSAKMSGGKAQKETVPSEADSNYMTISKGETPLEFMIELYGVPGEHLPMLIEGEWDDTTKKYSDPIGDREGQYLSVVLITETNSKGKYAKITYPFMFVAGEMTGGLTNGELGYLALDCEANTPESAAGVKASKRTIEWIDAA